MSNISLNNIKQLFSFQLLMPLIMLVGVGLIFFPFGFSQIALIEEWGVSGVISEQGPLYFITKYTPLAIQRMRPLTVLPHSLAYLFDKNSFFYWDLMQFFSTWLKGVTVGAIIWWLYPKRWIAIIGGLLFMLYPADTMQFSLRSIHINVSVATATFSIAILLWATRSKEFWAQTILSFCAGSLFLFASLTYETALFLAPLPLILWWAKYGFNEGLKTLRSQGVVIFFWSAAILIELAYIYWVGSDPDLYQSQVSNAPGDTLKTIFQSSPKLITVGFYRTFLQSWYDGVNMLLTPGDWVIYLPIAILFILVLVLCLYVKSSDSDKMIPQFNNGLLIRWFIASILITALGYSPYLALASHVLITQRTYLYAGIGGALFCMVLIAALRERSRFLGAGLAGVLLLLGIASQWTQFDHYGVISNKQKAILSGILEAAPHLEANQKLLIIDRSGSLGNTWMLKSELLGSALTYLYGKKTDPVICMEPGLIWSSFATDSSGRMGYCEEQKEDWKIGQSLPQAFSLPKEKLVTLIIEQDGNIHPSIDNQTISSVTPLEKTRWEKVLGCWPAKACLAKVNKKPLPDHFKFGFGKWWSMEEPIPGVGWQDSQWMVPAWKPRSFAWINQPKSTLVFQLSPRSTPYIFQLGLAIMISESAKQGLKVFVNGHSVPYHWEDAMQAKGIIDPTWLKEGPNELLFLTEIHPEQGVSLGVEYVSVEPEKLD